LSLSDIPKVIYAPQKAFKHILENPKYLGAILILVVFIGLQVGYEFAQISKTQIEQTSPPLGYSPVFINATNWNAGADTTLTNDFDTYFNYTLYEAGYGMIPGLFGNSSLALASTTHTPSATLNLEAGLTYINNQLTTMGAAPIATNVDCSANTGFSNLTLILQQTNPTTPPQTATLTLYSVGNNNYYTYDLTQTLSNLTANNNWNNYTIPVGPATDTWTSNGAPMWSNITRLSLQLTYPDGSDATVNIGALYFGGQYKTLIDINSTGFLLNFLQQFSLQFLFTWFLMSVLIYVFFKGLKTEVTWKPIFVALGFALIIMVIRAAINLIATLALPAIYYPFDVWPGLSLTPYGAIFYPNDMGTTLFAQSQTAIASASAANAIFSGIAVTMFFVSYVWLALLGVVLIGALKPEFSVAKRIGISAVSVAVTLIALLFLGVGA
jgi:hypothetical protein